jgi:hypothetical protein
MVKALSNIINKLKNKRVVLTGDYNSTKTKSSYDTRGPLPPTNAKNTNAATVQTILDTLASKTCGYTETMRLGSWRDQNSNTSPTGTTTIPKESA